MLTFELVAYSMLVVAVIGWVVLITAETIEEKLEERRNKRSLYGSMRITPETIAHASDSFRRNIRDN